MSSNYLILCRHLLLLPSIFPSIRVFSQESVLGIRWPKDWSFSISTSNQYSGLISFRMAWLDLLAVQGTLKNLFQTPQFKSINSSLLSFLYTPTLTSIHAAVAAAKSRQSCPTLCDPIDGSSPRSPIPGILQARILDWVAISFSNACMHAKSLQLCPTLCNPMDSSPPGSPIHRILQARIHTQNRNKPTDIEHKIMVNKGKNAE